MNKKGLADLFAISRFECIVQWMHNITRLERGSILLSWDWESHLGKNIRAYNCHNYSLSIHNSYDEHHFLVGYLYGVWSKNNYMYIQFDSHYIIMSLFLDQTLWTQWKSNHYKPSFLCKITCITSIYVMTEIWLKWNKTIWPYNFVIIIWKYYVKK